MKSQVGKGDTYRKVDGKRWSDGYDSIKWQSKVKKELDIKPDPVKLMGCPECGWLITRQEWMDVIINPECPRCGKSKFSWFSVKQNKGDTCKR